MDGGYFSKCIATLWPTLRPNLLTFKNLHFFRDGAFLSSPSLRICATILVRDATILVSKMEQIPSKIHTIYQHDIKPDVISTILYAKI